MTHLAFLFLFLFFVLFCFVLFFSCLFTSRATCKPFYRSKILSCTNKK